MRVVITLLGGFSAHVDHGPVDSSAWRRRHALSLVKLLALSPGRRLHREQVMDLLWPELTPGEAAPRLHKAAHYARRALADPLSLALADETVALFPDRQIQVDTVEFETAARAALNAADPGLAGQAADAYAGDLLPEDPYAEWAEEARDRLRLTYLDVLRLAGRWEQLLTVEPADEQAHLALITRLARSGDRRGALRQFERLELALRRELGVRPSRQAVALRTRLLASPDPPTDGALAAAGPLLVGAAGARRSVAKALDVVSGGSGRTLFVSGPAGVGKTAMLAWAEREAARRGMRVGSGVAAQVEGAWPYAPVLEALADLSRRHPALLDGLDDELRKEIESGLAGRTVEWNARGGHQRLFVAAAELVRLAAGTGVMLVVDDADQADDASLRLLHYLARSTVSERVLLVLGHRNTSPELIRVRRSLLGRGTALTLDLQPLPREDVRALVQHIAPTADDALVDTVYAASGGVPLFVVELARSAAAGRDLVAESLVPPSGSDQPGSLAAAAILGSAFDTDEFIEVTGLGEHDAYAALERASEQNLLLRTDSGWEFRHALVRDALLAKVQPAQLRRLHRRAADALQVLHRPATRIGFHLVQAGDRAGAVPWVRVGKASTGSPPSARRRPVRIWRRCCRCAPI